MKYRLGLDVGTNSLGWSVLEIDEAALAQSDKIVVRRIEAAGARVFSDGRDNKSKATLAADRRDARSARKRRDRYLQRRTYLLNELTKAGLFPPESDEAAREALQKLNPLELRARLLTENAADILDSSAIQITAQNVDLKAEYLVGRALFHLNQRRGFQSNRKDKSDEGGKDGTVSQSERKLMESMKLIGKREEFNIPKEDQKDWSKEERARYQEEKKQAEKREHEARQKAIEDLNKKANFSYGAFLWNRQNKENPLGTRVRREGTGKNDLYEFYPTRAFYEDEFHKIWNKQAEYFAPLMQDKERFEHFKKIIFTQRPLKPQKRGKCAYMKNYDRTFRAMPSFQRYRIYQEVNNLKWNDEGGFADTTDRQVHATRNALIELLEKPATKEGNLVWSKVENFIKNAKLTNDSMLAQDNVIQFNFAKDSKREKGLEGNHTSNIMQHEDYVGAKWHEWSLDRQDEFIDIIIKGTPKQQERDKNAEKNKGKKTLIDASQDDKEIAEYLMKNFDLSEHAAIKCTSAHLLDGTANVSQEAARKMLKKMREGIEGVDKETGEVGNILPIQPKAAAACAEDAKSCAEDDPEKFTNPFRSKGDDGKRKIVPKLPYYGKAFAEDGQHIIPGDNEKCNICGWPDGDKSEMEGCPNQAQHDEKKYYGGVTNPTVHIALNQIKQTVNELIDRFGDRPVSIAIELGRDLPVGEEGRRDIEKEQKANQDKNERYDKELREDAKVPVTPDNRLRLELWKKQDKICPYTLKPIGCAALFSGAVEIDHILPYSRSQDDSRANKVVCMREANRDKGNKTPWEAFHDHPQYNWDNIKKNAVARYYHNKDNQWKESVPTKALWRFKENAFKIWEGDSEEIEKAAKKMKASDHKIVKDIGKQILKNGVGSLSEKQKKIAEEHDIPIQDFSPRHLNDTRYIGRLAREYLENVCSLDKIDVLTGQHTAMLRGHWGLNSILWEGNYSVDLGRKLIGVVHDYKSDPSRNEEKLVNVALEFVHSDQFTISEKNPDAEGEKLLAAVTAYTENAEEAKKAVIDAAILWESKRPKNRNDHRHHAIDAIVIGMTNKSMIQKIATEANKQEKTKQEIRENIDESGRDLNKDQDKKLDQLFPKNKKGHSTIAPWEGFREEVGAIARNIIVSHKAKKKKLRPGGTTDGQLHNETALGLIEPVNEDKNEWKTVVRRPIDYLTDRKRVENIRDAKLKKEFLQAFDDAEAVGKKGVDDITDLAKEKGIRRLRCFGPKQAIPIRDKNGNIYKGYQGDSNWGMEIYAFPENHKKADKWEGVVISRFNANKQGFQPGTTYRPHPEAKLVMRLQINDCIQIEDKGEKRILYFVKCNQAKRMYFAEHNEANLRKRNDDENDSFKYFVKSVDGLKMLNARKVHVSPTGQINVEIRKNKSHKKRQKRREKIKE